jgi:hypothetical protein
MPTATRQVIAGATGKDPGDLKSEVAQAAKDPKHDWNSTGMWPTKDNMGPVMQAHGAQVKEIDFSSASNLVGKIGTTPVEVAGKWSTGGLHEITIRQDPATKSYIVTNPTGKVGVGGEIHVTSQQIVKGAIPSSTKPGAPTLSIVTGHPAFTATPMKTAPTTQKQTP